MKKETLKWFFRILAVFDVCFKQILKSFILLSSFLQWKKINFYIFFHLMILLPWTSTKKRWGLKHSNEDIRRKQLFFHHFFYDESFHMFFDGLLYWMKILQTNNLKCCDSCIEILIHFASELESERVMHSTFYVYYVQVINSNIHFLRNWLINRSWESSREIIE